MHLDYTEFWESDLKCQCGNFIAVITKRTEEEMMYWMDDPGDLPFDDVEEEE
jgi:hypothetical protein